MVRPLMVAEGRPSENHTIINLPIVQQQSSCTQAASGHLLSIRPPATGAPGHDVDLDGFAVTDELTEVDQSTIESISEQESNIIQNGGNFSSTNNSLAIVVNECQRALNADDIIDDDNNSDDPEDEEYGDDGNLVLNGSNDGAIRLSGDGEQGL